MVQLFEFDPTKSEANKSKHGLNFIEAQGLWNDEQLLIIPAKYLEDEDRWAAIGRLDSKHWTAIFTRRADVIRLISVRRARKEEEEFYESQRTRSQV
jgi:uncharacterized protein